MLGLSTSSNLDINNNNSKSFKMATGLPNAEPNLFSIIASV